MLNIHFSFLLRGAVPQLEDKGKSINSRENDVEVPILCIRLLFGTVFNFVLLLKITPMVIFGNLIMKQPTLYRILFLQTNKNKFICPIHWNRPSPVSSFWYFQIHHHLATYLLSVWEVACIHRKGRWIVLHNWVSI